MLDALDDCDEKVFVYVGGMELETSTTGSEAAHLEAKIWVTSGVLQNIQPAFGDDMAALDYVTFDEGSQRSLVHVLRN